MVKKFFLLILIFYLSPRANAEILFEGYYKIEIEGQHIGYSIIREEFDRKKKEFRSIRFTKTAPSERDINMSSEAVCDDKFKPKSLRFTYLDKTKKKRIINGKVSGDKLLLEISEGGPVKKEQIPLPKGVFFSSFVSYLIMQKGLKTDTQFAYDAIAEETGTIESGQTYIEKQLEEIKGKKLFKSVNKFAGISFVAYLNEKGETIISATPAQNEYAELVKTPEEATRGIPMPKSTLEALFGRIPAGTKNSLNASGPTMPDPSPNGPTKQPAKTSQKLEVPTGQGIIIKTQTKELGK